MPFYREYYVNDSLKTAGGQHLSITDQARVTSWRSRPNGGALHTQLLNDKAVDPYAWFLTNSVGRDYREAIEARGLRARGRPDFGKPYESIRHVTHASRSSARINASQVYDNVAYYYGGAALNSVHDGNFAKLPTFESEGLHTFARQAYSRVAPTSVVFDAANFLGETLQRLPSIAISSLRRDANRFRSYGVDYMNVAFGWKPFVADIINAATALGRATQQLADNGRRVHRRYSVQPSVAHATATSFTTSDTAWTTATRLGEPMVPAGLKEILGFPSPLYVAGQSVNFTQKYASKVKRQRRWFEGEFTSFYPLGFDPSNYFDKLSVLVNVKMTPEVLWNLAPWSWLADWTLRIGDSIRANQMAANDLLIMHYGYAMEETVYTTTTSVSKPPKAANTSYADKAWSTAVTTRKRRIRANPYGFGVGGADALSGDQWSILGALALTRLPEKPR